MLRRTFLAAAGALAAAAARLRGQTRAELTRLADQQLAVTPYKSAEIMQLDTPALVGILNHADSEDFAKAKACQRLAVVGDERAVPAVASLLGDPSLGHYARTALEPMPGSAADKALRDSLARLQGSLLVGAIHSIGTRRDPDALTALARLRKSDDGSVAAAASWAINRIRRP